MHKCKDCKNLYNKNSNCYNYECENNKSCDMFINATNGLTEKENVIMDHIVKAWNEFVKLERYHPDELNDFGDAIHKLESILGLRILRRDYPKYWIKK